MDSRRNRNSIYRRLRYQSKHACCSEIIILCTVAPQSNPSFTLKSYNKFTPFVVILLPLPDQEVLRSSCLLVGWLVCWCMRVFVSVFVNMCLGRISRKRLEIEVRFQWNCGTTIWNDNRMVTWSWCHVILKSQGLKVVTPVAPIGGPPPTCNGKWAADGKCQNFTCYLPEKNNNKISELYMMFARKMPKLVGGKIGTQHI